mmetsp:Transcript_144381/g.359893  ORF Transcript_144381/g.359893 Transcript_144381/m.359893 type:complete len:237 (+) Transcript_144381:1-711(+)
MPRVVCLHGTACSKQIFTIQLSKLIPKAKGKIELIFLDGRGKIEAGPAFDTMQKYFPGCPNYKYDDVMLDSKGWRIYADPQGTLDWLQTQLAGLAPVDGILGFSQGANFALMLAAQAATGAGVPLGFTVLLSPNAPGFTEQLPELFAEPIPVPTLIVRGEQEGYGAGMEPLFNAQLEKGAFQLDSRGEDAPAAHVAKLCANATMLAHKENHRPLPGDKQTADEIVDRIIAFVEESC